jgi:hypothetical protein
VPISPPPDLRRGGATRAQKETFVVFLERGLPESYLQWVKRALHHHQITERFPDAGESPLEVVKRAQKAGRDARAKGSEFDHVWCLFEGLGQTEVEDMRAQTGVELAYCAPSIELWLLLHFEDVPDGTSMSDIHGALTLWLPNRDLDVVEGALEGRFEVAAGRARGIRLGASMSTDIDAFVRQVRASLAAFDPDVKPRI